MRIKSKFLSIVLLSFALAFSQPAEQAGASRPLNLEQILASGQTKALYRASIAEISDSISSLSKKIQSVNKTPAKKAEAKSEFEKQAQYEARVKTHDSLQSVGKNALLDSLKKHETQLRRTNEVLADYVLQIENSASAETVAQPRVEVGSYDAEKEEFEAHVLDTAETANLDGQSAAIKKSPFIWSGKVGVPLDDAKTINRQEPNFAVSVEYLNYPFVFIPESADTAHNGGGASVNLAMKNLKIQRNGKQAKTSGTFSEISKYKTMPNYIEWKLHSDSLLGGFLKPRNLNADYVFKYDYSSAPSLANSASNAAVSASKSAEGAENAESGLGLRGVSRIALSALAVGAGAFAIVQNGKAGDEADKINKMRVPPKNSSEYPAFVSEVKKANGNIKDRQSARNAGYIGAGVCLGMLAVTFAF